MHNLLINRINKLFGKLLKHIINKCYLELTYFMKIGKWKELSISKKAAFIIIGWDKRYYQLVGEAEMQGFAVAARSNMLPYKTSDRIYILGSGPSINTISSEQWAVIKEHDSFAFNWFFAHPHVPTFFHMELLDDNFETFRECYNEKSCEFKSRPAILNYRKLPAEASKEILGFTENLYVSVPKSLGGTDESDFRGLLDYFYFKRNFLEENLLIQYDASLVIAISFAVLLGYKQIILAGIDLDSYEYFFYDKSRYNNNVAAKIREFKMEEQERRKRKVNVGQLHRIADPGLCEQMTVDQAVLIMNEMVMKPTGIELYLQNSRSILYPSLQVFKEN